jgi:hypothetical protein
MPEDELRAYRVRTRLRELSDMLTNDPALRERFDAAVHGDLPAPEVLTMANDTAISLRLPEVILQRADELIDAMARDAELATIVGGKVTRSTVIRVALLRGLRSLEEDYCEGG